MKWIKVFLFVLLLAGCGQSETMKGDAGGKSNSSEQERSCPSGEVDGQTIDEVPQEELEKYDQADATAAVQMERYETFQSHLKQEGISMDEMDALGNVFFADTSVVVLLKKELPSEKREPVEQIVEQMRSTYNKDAVIMDYVAISVKEKEQRITEVSNTLREHETINEKLSSVSTCGGKSMDIQVTTLEEMTEEEKEYLTSEFDFPVYAEVMASETAGYVTGVREGGMLVGFGWFSNAPGEVKVGDYVKVTHGPVAESFPSQGAAYKTEIQDPRQPEGADKTDRQVVKKALSSFEKGRLNVTEVTYDEEKDEWQVTISTGIMEEDEEETVTVPD
ncbi:hypothetical protein [Salimicrobium halophilum]|uniref:Uncharacterized protein n=1 Tax=Salimicrobium halophilum TaxID=86666 RepID=A0A1G8R2X1_9BACI|nr:hypothetical protein [Salimicrobium halophilum]SDJ10905.1 hypothetical protein SAMN04490247_0767 [Salimicrobium halophilum]